MEGLIVFSVAVVVIVGFSFFHRPRKKKDDLDGLVGREAADAGPKSGSKT